MKKFLYFSSLVFIGFASHGQLNNSYLYSPSSDSVTNKNARFGFYLDNVNYIRNTEYRSKVENGATMAGTQIWPQGIYRANDYISFKAGVFIQKDIGNTNFRMLIPTYTVCYTNKNIKVNFGTLDGSLDHNLIEPLYAMENFINKRIENGLQAKGKFKRLTYDTWLDWEKMIYKNSTTPEVFTVGISTDFKLVNHNNFMWSVPIQIMAKHEGGEIYQGPHKAIKSQYNFVYGTRFTKTRPGKVIYKIDLQGYLTFYEDGAPSKADSFRDGTGNYLALSLHAKNIGVMFNYWDAHQFISPLGDPLFLCRSEKYPGDYYQYQKMAMIRFMYEATLLDNFRLVARLNNIYNIHEKTIDNVVEVYFKYNFGL